MSAIELVRHRGSICGYLSDAISGARIPRGTIELAPADQKTETRADGFYYFLDLPDGPYTLHAAAPALGSRYGTVTTAGVTVASDAAGRPIFDPKGNLGLPPTRLTGSVKRSDTLAAIPYAEVRLRASNTKARSNKLGEYALSAVEAGTQTVQVSAPGYASSSQVVTLMAGQETLVDFSLAPS